MIKKPRMQAPDKLGGYPCRRFIGSFALPDKLADSWQYWILKTPLIAQTAGRFPAKHFNIGELLFNQQHQGVECRIPPNH